MRKILSLLIVLALCTMTFTSCKDKEGNTNTENKDGTTVTDIKADTGTVKEADKTDKEIQKTKNEEDAVLQELKKQISDSGAKLGVAYLGCFGETFDDTKEYFKDLGLYEDYPFVEEMELSDLIVNENNEMYLIVPAGNTETVKVYDGILNEEFYVLEKGELLGEAIGGKPFLLLCNVSEVIPNVIIETDNIEYIPFVSGENGKLVPNRDVYDFSPYEKIKEFFGFGNGDIADGADPAFCGLWTGESEDGDYVLNTLMLSLYVDGTAEYVYGIGNSEPTEGFEGEWTYDSERDMILLDMFGGPYNDYLDSDEKYIDPYKLQCGFKWDIEYRVDGAYLVLTHEEGDPILWGKNGATFELCYASDFEEESYTYLVGSWGIISELRETYLELFDDGQAHYYVVENDVVTKEVYGLWEAEGLTLYLNLQGHYDDSEAEKVLISGEYGISYDGEFLTLSPLNEASDAMTAFMQENGYDSFILCGVG